MAAGFADVKTHILDDPDHTDIGLRKHRDGPVGVNQREVLRRGDDDRAIWFHLLRECQLNVPGSRRHVDHQHIQITPVGQVDQLGEGRRRHRAAPDNRLPRFGHHAHRQGFESPGLHRLDTVGDQVGADMGVHQGRDRRPIDIAVQQADLAAHLGQRHRQIGRYR